MTVAAIAAIVLLLLAQHGDALEHALRRCEAELERRRRTR